MECASLHADICVLNRSTGSKHQVQQPTPPCQGLINCETQKVTHHAHSSCQQLSAQHVQHVHHTDRCSCSCNGGSPLVCVTTNVLTFLKMSIKEEAQTQGQHHFRKSWFAGLGMLKLTET